MIHALNPFDCSMFEYLEVARVRVVLRDQREAGGGEPLPLWRGDQHDAVAVVWFDEFDNLGQLVGE